MSNVCFSQPVHMPESKPNVHVTFTASHGDCGSTVLQELQDHIVRYCAINPRYYKCGFPPYSFGEELSEKLRNVVLACDSGIPVRDKSKLRAMLKRRAKQKRVMEKVKVAKKPRKITQKDLRPD